MKATVTFTFLDYWHMGTGTGKGASMDSLVARTPAGLPVVPGRTVKGLFREACSVAEELGHAEAGTTARLFGTGEMSSAQRVGELFFTDVDLGPEMEEWAAGREPQREIGLLFRAFSATALDESGVAREGTLRVKEVAVPMALVGEVEVSSADGEGNIQTLSHIAPLIRSAGTNRHRGFGRVQVKVGEVQR